MIRALTMLVALAACPDAWSCRCAQRDLGDYFDHAQAVVIGRLLSSSSAAPPGDPPELRLELEVLARPYKPLNTDLEPGDRYTVNTAANSAACGVAAVPGAVYVLFAGTPDGGDGPPTVDTCSGTRIHLPTDRSPPAGFRDVPARHVPGQLNALAGLETLRAIASVEPGINDPDSTALVGLLDIEGLAHAGFAPLHRSPARDAPQIARFEDYEAVYAQEASYESVAAVVFARVDGWYKLRLADGAYGWLPPDFAGTFFPYDSLPVQRLAYVGTPWHGFVWPRPGAGLPIRVSWDGADEQPVEVLESRRLAGSLWFRVRFLEASPCEGGEPGSRAEGWVPAYRADARPLVWFYSRGC